MIGELLRRVSVVRVQRTSQHLRVVGVALFPLLVLFNSGHYLPSHFNQVGHTREGKLQVLLFQTDQVIGL